MLGNPFNLFPESERRQRSTLGRDEGQLHGGGLDAGIDRHFAARPDANNPIL